MFKQVKRFMRDEEGATAIEYGLIVGLIAVVLIAVFASLGGSLDDLFQMAADEVGTAATPPSDGG
jgi:pilus assembly protein Flp/PilA